MKKKQERSNYESGKKEVLKILKGLGRDDSEKLLKKVKKQLTRGSYKKSDKEDDDSGATTTTYYSSSSAESRTKPSNKPPAKKRLRLPTINESEVLSESYSSSQSWSHSSLTSSTETEDKKNQGREEQQRERRKKKKKKRISADISGFRSDDSYDGENSGLCKSSYMGYTFYYRSRLREYFNFFLKNFNP